MTRLIPGHDAPEVASAVESAQVTAHPPGAATELAHRLVRALEAPHEPFAVRRRVSLHAIPADPGGPSRERAAGPREPVGTPGPEGARHPAGGRHHDLTEDAARPAVGPEALDTPELAVVRPIGHVPSPNGDPTEAAAADAAADPADDLPDDPSDDSAADLADDSADFRSGPPGAAILNLPLAPTALRAEPVADIPPGVGPEVTAEITAGLWAEFHASRSRQARDRIVVHYRALVRGIAGRMAGGLPSHVDVADLVQVGMFGLIDAVERFDPAREVRFASYAAQRIRGAMLDELRAQDWVPRSARARRREIERTREHLEGTRGRTVADDEVAAELRIGLRELRGALQHRQLVSVEALEAGTPGPVSIADLLPDDAAPDPVAIAEHAETVRELVGAVGSLGERDRQVVRLYYLENRTLAEIGRMLGVTESRVCQLHARLVTRLRTRLTETVAG
jgi:RNA polymerase sigma factor FliA